MRVFDEDILHPLVRSHIRGMRYKKMREIQDGKYEVPGCYAYIRPLSTIRQTGPQCGLVALQMGGKLLEGLPAFSTDDVFEKSKSLGFTQYGEMFSNEWMATLATTIWPNVTATVAPLPDAYELVKKIFNKKVILFAYDCGYNFDPTLDKGQRAHWAVVTGFLYASFMQTSLVTANPTDVPLDPEEEETFHIFAHHGKSDNTAFFNWKEVRNSNSQLNEVRTDKDYIVPDDGMHLKGTCVVLSKDD